MPGPSSATVRVARPPSIPAASRTRVPGGVCTSAFSTRTRPIWRIRSGSPSASGGPAAGPGPPRVEVVPGRDPPRLELRRELRREPGQVDRLRRDRQPACVEPREVEQLRRELREPRHLLAHLHEELLARLLVQARLLEQLEEAGERE